MHEYDDARKRKRKRVRRMRKEWEPKQRNRIGGRDDDEYVVGTSKSIYMSWSNQMEADNNDQICSLDTTVSVASYHKDVHEFINHRQIIPASDSSLMNPTPNLIIYFLSYPNVPGEQSFFKNTSTNIMLLFHNLPKQEATMYSKFLIIKP